MRVHRLEIEAFGPFADPVVVDVDALSADGLFLIHGPTGSGKTSLLDAICFALYADVPGSRSKRGLRSDHARPDAVPRVTLELTAGERRLRITRSPEFQRPKKRGTGTVKVQAMVTLEERRGARWLALSTRHDEVADVVKDALGMGMAQFAKVVLLPQGDFAAFLRATPEDRREVLERLFDITAFSDVEAWLAEARRTAGADAGAAVAALSSVLTRAEDVLTEAGLAGDPDTGPALPATGPAVTGADRSGSDAAVSPEGSPGRAVVPPLSQVPPESVGAHLRDLCALLDARVSTTMAAFDTASGAERAAAEALAAGRALAELRARGTRALARLEALDAAGPGHAERVAAVSAAERAATLAGHLTALDRATDELTDARAAAAAARRSLPPTVTADLDDDDVDAVLSRVHDLDEAAAALAREAEEAALRKRQHDELLERLELLGSRTASTASRLERDEAERDELALVVQRSASGAGRVSELELRLVGAVERVATLDAAEDDLRRSQALAPRHAELRTAALDRREQLLDLRQRRLDGMAAELARSLTDGDPCPVCGGAEHPAPATVAEPVVADDVAAAEHRLLAAEAELRRVEGEMEALRTSARTRLALLGDADRPGLEGAVVRATQALAAARADALAHTEAVARLQVLEAAVEASRTALAAVGARADEARAGLDAADAAALAAGHRVRALLTAHATCPCGSADPGQHPRTARALTSLSQAVAEVTRAQGRLATASADLDGAMAVAGFADPGAVRSAALPATGLERLRAQVQRHVDDTAAARAVADDPEVVAALSADAPDVEALQAADRSAREALLRTAAAQDDAARALRALERLLPAVDDACAEVARTAARDARVRELADTTSGTGPENTLRMRLTAYVLAARLETVAVLANERLAVMGAGRYVLEHSDERAARGARSGLGLRVLDQWTGRVRDTATLSGGESFMASLALALGLADAVREETGGLDLGTLFIDEGFGSLDDDSLEQVLSVLDGLREGGRAVGVVSHVADLRARITHQAVVHKRASGSTVEVRVGGRAAEPAA